MGYYILEPGDDGSDHPAYRYLIVQFVNDIDTGLYGEPYGTLMILEIEGFDPINIVSRKQVGEISGNPIYEFDLSGIIQEHLSETLPDYGSGGHYLDLNGKRSIIWNVYDLYINSEGLVQQLEGESENIEIWAHHSVMQHEEERIEYHFTMQAYQWEYNLANLTRQPFLTKKPDNSKVCLSDSEHVVFIPANNDSVNCATRDVRVRVYDSSGTLIQTGVVDISAITIAAENIISDSRRIGFGVGPVNLNAITSWDYAFPLISGDFITESAAYYDITLGEAVYGPLFPFPWTLLDFVEDSTPKRTYHLNCTCCDTRERFYFVNSLGAIDFIAFNDVTETQLSAKSQEYQKKVIIPHDITSGGATRLNTNRPRTRKYFGQFEKTDIEWLEDFVGAPKMWRWNGTHYVPVKMKDDTYKIDANADGGILIEFDIENANDNFSQRN